MERDYKFDARLKYEFMQHQTDVCLSCGRPQQQHADGKCLFEPTTYQVSALHIFLEDLIREGGTLEIKTSQGHTLKQKLLASFADHMELTQVHWTARTEIGTNGVATVTLKDDNNAP